MIFLIKEDIRLKLQFRNADNTLWCKLFVDDKWYVNPEFILKKNEICELEYYRYGRLDIIYKNEKYHLYNFSDYEFNKMFIPLAEFREERINKILEI